MDENAIFDVNFMDIQHIIQEPINIQNIPKVLTINGKFLDEGMGLELAELFPPDVLGAKNQMNIRYWTCKHCLQIETSISAYAKHLKEHYKSKHMPKESIQNNDRIECDICDKKFTQKFFLHRHMQKHTGEFTCSMCLTICGRRRDLQIHQKNCKDGDGIILQCVICKMILPTRRALKDHLILNHSSVPTQNNQILVKNIENGIFPCSYCEKSYLKRYLLDKHITNKHNAYGMNADKECFICNLKFKSKTSALRHRKIHTEGKIYNCTHCDNSYAKEYLLKQHIIKHETVSYSCPYCDCVVRYQHSMVRHMKNSHADKTHEWNSIKIKALEGNKPLKKSVKTKKIQSTVIHPLRSKLPDQNIIIHNEFINYDADMFNEDKIEKFSLFDDFKIDYPLDGTSIEDLGQFPVIQNNFEINYHGNEDKAEDQIYVDTDTGELVYL